MLLLYFVMFFRGSFGGLFDSLEGCAERVLFALPMA